MIALAAGVTIAPLLVSLLLGMGVPPEGASPAAGSAAGATTAPTPAAVASTRGPRAPWDRARLIETLERLIRTGEPRHVSHDEGEALQDALNEALNNGVDPELQWLATRAAAPIVTSIAHPLSSRTTPGAVTIRSERVLTLPWPVEYVADVDVRVDGGPWKKLAQAAAGVTRYPSLSTLPSAAAMTPGFHTLSTRARLRYSAAPPGMPRQETRVLATLHYGIWGARQSSDPVRPFFDTAASISTSVLDPHLPDMPFSDWLRELPHANHPMDSDSTDWHAEWCGMHEWLSDEVPVGNDVCIVVRRSGSESGSFAQVWIKVGTLRFDDDGARWVRTAPGLAAAYVYFGTTRVRTALPSIADLLSRGCDEWPKARLVVNAAGISIGLPTIVPNAPTPLRILVANMGDADVHGIGIHVLAASEKHLPAMTRNFVRTIRAGGSVEIETTVVFPAPYGIVDVMLVPDHSDVGPRIDDTPENHYAITIVNARAAPPGYVQRVCLEVAKQAPSCPR